MSMLIGLLLTRCVDNWQGDVQQITMVGDPTVYDQQCEDSAHSIVSLYFDCCSGDPVHVVYDMQCEEQSIVS